MKKKLLTLLTLALAVCSGAWAEDVTLFSTDFSDASWSSYTKSSPITAKSTVNGIYFNCADYVANNALYFNGGGNISSSRFCAIHLTGVNKSIKVVIENNKSARVKYLIKEETKISSPDSNIDPGANTTTTIDYDMTGSGTELTFYFYQQGSGSPNIVETITITTPQASGKADPELSVSPSSMSLTVGNSQQITATQSGDGVISFSSSNENVATVSSTGLITAVGVGNAIITTSVTESESYDPDTKTTAVTVPSTALTIAKYATMNGSLVNSSEGMFSISGDTEFNTKYVGTYDGTEYTSGLKLQNGTSVNFTTVGECDLVVVQSAATNLNLIKIDNTTFVTDYGIASYYYDNVIDGVRVYTYKGLAAGEHSITRTSELGLLYIGITDDTANSDPEIKSVSPNGGNVDGGSTITITGIGTIYYQLSESATAPTAGGEGWTEGSTITVPNVNGTRYLYAYANNNGSNSDVTTKLFTITKTATATTTTTWDFTNWSAATKAGVLADDTNWNQTETSTGGNDFKENLGRAYKNALASAELQYDGTAIAETEGLQFTANAYGMAVLFDFDHTDLGTYNGNSYIWLYGKTSTITIPNVPAGATIEIGVESHKDSEARGVTLNNCTQTQGEATAKAYQVCKWTVNTTGDITITPSKGLHIYYITLTKAEPAVAFTPANAKSTYVTTKALDFSDVEGLKAYVATAASAGKVTLKEVGAVPAGTPLMLIGTAGTEYTVPVAASASAPATNLFRAGDGTTVFDGTTYDYILYTDGLFHPIGSGTVATTKAYLHCDSDPTAAGARSLAITFDDDVTTGVTEIVNSKLSNSKYFDLQGRRVAAPQKGLYIVNGKKVVVK